jgi:hypothetical protein
MHAPISSKPGQVKVSTLEAVYAELLVRGLEPVACEYEHGWRDAGRSDHAAMWADLRFAGTRGG